MSTAVAWIYVLNNIQGDPFYIGSTTRLSMRKEEHQRIFPNASFEVLEETTLDKRYLKEACWIKVYKDKGAQLLNVKVPKGHKDLNADTEWRDRIICIKYLLRHGYTVEGVADILDVSRQRIYQILDEGKDVI